MAFVVILAFLLVMAAPSLQQEVYGGTQDHPSCYGRCNDAYRKNPNDYRVVDCNCNQYTFQDRGRGY